MVTEFDVSIKIVTDSTSDIPIDLASSLGITIVPGYVRFGNDTYRDGTDISAEAFYQKLVNSPFHQITSEPTPDDFEKVYSDCSLEAEHIISIHASSKVSKILKSAIAAKKRIKGPCHIEIIDSRSISIGLGLIVENAARIIWHHIIVMRLLKGELIVFRETVINQVLGRINFSILDILTVQISNIASCTFI